MKALLRYVDVFSDKLIADGGSWHPDNFHPFHRACWGQTPRHTETVKVLLAHGVPADIVKRGASQTCMEMTRNEGTRKLLLEWTDQNRASAEEL